MVNERRASSACRCHPGSSFGSQFGLFYLAAFIFAFAHAQEAYHARLESGPSKEKEEISPLLYRDEGYFWEQTKQNHVPHEQIYDENADPIQLGMRVERRERQRGDDVPEYEPEDEWNAGDSKEQFVARHETVVDREMADTSAGNERPCSRGKVCAMREESRALMIENLKRNILTQLKMSEPPNITVPKISFDSPPLRRIFKKYGIKPPTEESTEPDIEEDPEWVEDETTKEKVISYARPLPFSGQPGKYFKFNEEDMIHTVTSADIWFYIRGNPGGHTTMILEFYRYQPNSTHPEAPLVPVKFNRKVIKLQRKGHWRSFSIAAEVSRWFIDPSSNFGIDIRSPNLPDLVAMHPGPEEDDLKPMLEVDLAKNEYSRRRKRDLGTLTCNARSQEPRCCRYDLSIDFRSMGWDWIINPATYKSYYCSGDCPLLFLQTNQNRVIAMQADSDSTNAASPCCAPTKTSAMSMLYFDNQQNIIYSEVPDMVVDKCGCM